MPMVGDVPSGSETFVPFGIVQMADQSHEIPPASRAKEFVEEGLRLTQPRQGLAVASVEYI